MKRLLRFALKLSAPCAMLVAPCSLLFAQSLIRVPQDQPTIQAGIAAADSGDTVLVAEGTYFENIKVDKKIILGSLFIQDGDTTHISKTIIDGSTPARDDSAACVTVFGNTDTTLIISGFTITGGHGNVHSYPQLWGQGGGIEVTSGGARISHNIITGNSITTGRGTVYFYGGGIAVFSQVGYKYVIIEYNTISNNIVAGGLAEGAGMGIGNPTRVHGNRILDNQANGTTNGYGGGISSDRGTHTISGNLIKGNKSTYVGGGLVIYGNSNVNAYNNLIVQNTTVRSGGGIHQDGNSVLTLVHNTIALNYSGDAGAGFAKYGINTANFVPTSTVRGMNNIFWNRGPWSNEIFGAGFESLHNNLIRGESAYGEGNLSADPGFVDTVSFELSSGSPCIAAGITSKTILGASVTIPQTDYLGASRPRTGGTPPDLGAIESDFSVSPGTGTNRAELGKFMFGGVMRYYIVVRPPSDYNGKYMPVLMNLHGYGDNANSQMNYCQTHLLGDTVGFVTVYPQAFGDRWNSFISKDPDYPTPPVDDVGFLLALIDTLEAKADPKINRDSVFMCGSSNGGFMSLRFAAEYPKRIDGAASVSGAITDTLAKLIPDRPIPILLIHGTSDSIIPYGGSQYFYSVDSTVNFWRTTNSCFAPPESTVIETNPSDNSTVIKYTFPSATNSSKVVLIKVVNGGHTWPGGPSFSTQSGVINRDINANEEIVKFFIPYGLITGVREPLASAPVDFGLEQNYPNPFNPSTAISYQLSAFSRVSLRVYDLLGRVVATLVDEEQPAGVYRAEWNAAVSSGVYFYRLEATGKEGNSFVETKKMVLVR